jgi:hypothetical protein
MFTNLSEALEARPPVTALAEARAAILYIAAAEILNRGAYFRKSEIAPHLRPGDGKLVIWEGEGERRGWGRPYCRSRLRWLKPDLLQIRLSWANKWYAPRTVRGCKQENVRDEQKGSSS